MSDNRHSDFDFDEFVLDEDVDPLQIFRKRLDEEDAQAGPSFEGFRFPEPSAPAQPPQGNAFTAAPQAPQQPQQEQHSENFRERAAELADALDRFEQKLTPQSDSEPKTVYRGKAPVTIGETLHPDEMLVYDSELDDLDYDSEDDLPEIRDYLPIRFKRTGRVGIGGGLLYALFVISVSIVLAVLGWVFASDVLALNKAENEAVVVIEEYVPGPDDPVVNDDGQEIQVDIDQVASALKNAGIIEYKWLFKLYSRFSSADVKIDPGTYDVSTALDYRALVTALQFGSGSQEVTRITFPEGYTMDQIFDLLEENGICRASELYEAAANYDFDFDFLDGLELGDASRLEGYLFPDTYDFYQGESATVAITRFLNNTKNKLDDEVYSQASSLGYSVREILTIASMIEKEAANDSERPLIASVIYNRLNSGMQLQLDSTIHYILAQDGRDTEELTYDDLEIESPYNTYLNYGLPEGPICNPGMASIQAALNPDSDNYLYFFAYEGNNYFFSSYSEFEAFSAAPYAADADTEEDVETTD